MSCLPKPVLRGHVRRLGIVAIVTSISFAAFNGSMYYIFVRKPKEQIWDNFLKNFDDEALYNDLKKWGYLESSKNEND